MIKRTLTGAVILAFVYAWLFFSYIPIVLYIGTLILSVLAVLEIMRICRTDDHKMLYGAIVIYALLLLLPIPQYEYLMLLILPVALVMFGFMMAYKDKIRTFNSAFAIAVSITVILLFKAIPTLRALDNGSYYLTFAVTSCFVTDIAAFLFGRAFGSRKLCPRISPKKTIEGAAGGVACAVIVSMLAAIILNRLAELRFNVISLVIWAVLVSIIGQLGDLCMSVVKRIAGVKDFGALLPGHGGILDRFDSHILAIPFTLIFCALTGGFIL